MSSFEVVTNIAEITKLNKQLAIHLSKIFQFKETREITYPSGHDTYQQAKGVSITILYLIAHIEIVSGDIFASLLYRATQAMLLVATHNPQSTHRQASPALQQAF
jgi:hypothetical protein